MVGHPGEEVARGVVDAGIGRGDWRKVKGERNGEGDDAGLADEVIGGGLFEPAFAFGGFEFEFGDGFDGVAGGQDFGYVGVELLLEVNRAGKGAAGFLVEARGNGFDGAKQERVVGRVERVEGEAGFDGRELG
jgi:hypothetical protein